MILYRYDIGTPLGKMTAVGYENTLKALWFEGQRYFGLGLPKGLVIDNIEYGNEPVFDLTKKWLEDYFRNRISEINILLSYDSVKIKDGIILSPEGTDFRRDVWKILMDIPIGSTLSYNGIASVIASKYGKKSMSAQAVGGAVGHNPISILIPCHRVMGSDGSLTGYAGGIEKKAWLLSHESTVWG